MTITSRPLLRRLATAALLPVMALGLVFGQGSAAVADDLGDLGTGFMDGELVIHQNDTLDITFKTKIGGVDPATYCTTENLHKEPGVKASAEVVDGVCVKKATGASIGQLSSGGSMTIRHEDGKFYFELLGNGMGPGGGGKDTPAFTTTMTVIFPGKVTQASADGKISGNKVTWTNPKSSDTLSAEASDSSSSFMLWLILGALFLLLVAGGIILAVVLSGRKKKQTAMASAYPMPGAQFQAQGGYMPVQPQPYQQPGMVPQAPQMPQQPAPMAGQPYQQQGYAAQPPVAGQPYQDQGYGQPGGQPGGQPPYNPNQGY